MVNRVVIAAPASGHGKTTVATGLLAAFRKRGLTTAPFKVGPDYIDPGYHALAAGRPGRNLDPVLVGEDMIGPLFAHGSAGAEIAIVEGVMGLYDGRIGAGETGSTAQVAELLQAPVILVVDAAAQGRSVAALVHGFRSFGTVRLAGVILNRVGSDRHEQILRDACEEVGTPVLGALRRAEAVAAPSRHLGLVPAAERRAEALASVDALATLIAASVDLDAVAAVARSAPPLTVPAWSPLAADPVPGRPIVAVAGGPAFSFGYTETTELLAGAGAEVVTVDPLRDESLPAGTRALVVGGGFPEVYAAELSANAPLRASVAALAAAGGPIAAECAGLLWLCESLDGKPMCGVIDAEAAMTPSLTLGYRDAVALSDSPLAAAGTRVTGHEFHRTVVHPRSGVLLSPAGGAAWAWRGADPEGFAGPALHASYLHLHWAGHRGIAERLVRAAA
ncbi:putative cobyrinic acid a,c-diamide synthase [Actinoplanes missouriensis 431]|uniref:Hydrogenobyrinate a,c-diamide synthase n=1 Tax=Actinoplanes missouriensis (strain ATCC 14538 / DSM 43046 / CBS 188.64 / JCM 3121 / NBRC 102363 / NCIMB 12654 / NRRL B-3342 / UNCC 431) TaxID=512565 RepID=I0HCB2_ACTM4|nr:cobyrinate a,c-diamide synthase [Actinoplanes missouriensis]BAL90649.1 putative cobyrinic acid a,c-diamide synthase [Actinoplanes missouriensis 431]